MHLYNAHTLKNLGPHEGLKLLTHLLFVLNSYNEGVDVFFLIPIKDICKEEEGA